MARFHPCRPVVFQLFLLSLIAMVLTCACRQETTSQETTKQTRQILRQVDGLDIPLMENAAEQLLFARSNLNDPALKNAALKAVGEFHPEAVPERKLAALELAYLQLGEDYRLATPDQCRQALASYDKIFQTYRDDPAVAARTLWYQGWILSTLLADPTAGGKAFLQIINDYPQATVEFQPPPPWLNLEDGPPAKTPRGPTSPSLRWADLARIELVRNTADDHLAARITRQMLQEAPGRRLSALLIKNLLLFHGSAQESLELAAAFIEQTAETDDVLSDIRLLVEHLAAADRPGGAKP